MYDAGSSILAQKISQVYGVGQVQVYGSALPAVRVELNPDAVSKYNLGIDQIANVLRDANANQPKGEIAGLRNAWQLSTTDQIFKARQYKRLVVAYANGAQVRVSDLGDVLDSTENVRNDGGWNDTPSISLMVFRQPNANIIDTTDHVKAMIPQ